MNKRRTNATNGGYYPPQGTNAKPASEKEPDSIRHNKQRNEENQSPKIGIAIGKQRSQMPPCDIERAVASALRKTDTALAAFSGLKRTLTRKNKFIY